MSRIVAMKAYGYDWSNIHGLTMVEAAGTMASHGVDWALIQNQIDPLPGSAVDQQPPDGAYSDKGFRDALGERGIVVYESTSVFFDPESFAADPSLRPIDQHGQVFEPSGWYVGVCPSDRKYLARKAERISEVVDRLRPDGIFLSFIRFPGFWELWMPETARSDIAEYCFCDRCLDRFAQETGHSERRPEVLLGQLRPEWTAWKCGVIAEAAAVLRAAARDVDPGIKVLLNGFGLGTDDFGNAVEEVLAQRFGDLDASIDHYELMFYFQIQRRDPATWIPRRIADARARTNRTLLACLQAGAEYLEPEYASGNRAREITDADWVAALRASADADGVAVYSWRDLLANPARVAALLDYKVSPRTTWRPV
ncbi:hypothetical protein [Kibdelosporangium aridum]|nr:hypothetical protein [Kibdelosporangium aridum]